MHDTEYQVIPSVRTQNAQSLPIESMTFDSQQARDIYIRDQRAYGWEVFLHFMGREGFVELYAISRRKLS
ncbi:MAG: hypothetical protein ACPG47_09975 [Leucothrix sp.]|jgi:hypothetical protein|uniref:hypothetical protein n=1 Tax=uncultured Paraglaciecola sp. TaxID=1765024 RepID=UPI00260B2497|nr:hypothetical protein [uncultured Paraglaciecola sp.]